MLAFLVAPFFKYKVFPGVQASNKMSKLSISSRILRVGILRESSQCNFQRWRNVNSQRSVFSFTSAYIVNDAAASSLDRKREIFIGAPHSEWNIHFAAKFWQGNIMLFILKIYVH